MAAGEVVARGARRDAHLGGHLPDRLACPLPEPRELPAEVLLVGDTPGIGRPGMTRAVVRHGLSPTTPWDSLSLRTVRLVSGEMRCVSNVFCSSRLRRVRGCPGSSVPVPGHPVQTSH